MDASTAATKGRISKPGIRGLLGTLVLAVAYAWVVKTGVSLSFAPVPISILWPLNALLLVVILSSQTYRWWLVLLAVFPAHLALQLESGVPAWIALWWFASNYGEAVLGAVCIHGILRQRLRFDSVQHVIVFLLVCAFFAPIVPTFLDVTLVKALGWGSLDFWQMWRLRFFSDILAMLIFVPTLLGWNKDVLQTMRSASSMRRLEGGMLALALAGIGSAAFLSGFRATGMALWLLFASLAVLFWVAVRFPPFISSLSFLVFALSAVSGAILGQGPLADGASYARTLSLQLFLIGAALPQLLLSASMTERRRARESLRIHEQQLGLAAPAARFGTWDMDMEGNKGNWSAELNDILGLKDRDAGMSLVTFVRLIHPEDRGVAWAVMSQALAQGSSFETEFRIIRSDGKVRRLLSKGEALHGADGLPVRMAGVVVDVTERRLAESLALENAALREREARLRQLADAMPHIVWSSDADGKVDYVNRKWQEAAGAPEWTRGSRTWLPFIHPEDRQPWLEQWKRALAIGQAFESEYRICFSRDGPCRWHLVRALPVRDQDGTVARWIGTCTDIDARKSAELVQQASMNELEFSLAERANEVRRAIDEAERAIEGCKKAVQAERMSEAMFSEVFRLSPDAMSISTGIQGTILDVNDKWQALSGYRRAEVIGKTAQQLRLYVSEKDAATILERKREWGFVRDLDVEIRDKDGRHRQTILSGGEVEIGDKSCFISILRDVTVQRCAEYEAQKQREQLMHLTRVAILGEMSGALAHELNQPLAAILSNAQAARRFMGQDPVDMQEIREILDDIADDGARAGDVIRRLRTLFMKGEPKIRPLDVNVLVRETLELMHSEFIARKVQVVVRQAGSGPALVRGDWVQLQQVLLNLIINACEAMSTGPPDPRLLTLATDTDTDGNVRIDVTDTGPGIAPDMIDKVFESFFTTKAHGMGFGLSISRTIISEHGGSIRAANHPGGGATFRIILPACMEVSHE